MLLWSRGVERLCGPPTWFESNRAYHKSLSVQYLDGGQHCAGDEFGLIFSLPVFYVLSIASATSHPSVAQYSTKCYIKGVSAAKIAKREPPANGPVRAFKTTYFAKQAKDARIDDSELCGAVAALQAGQGNALGGGVWKKRLDKNRHRAIVLAKTDAFWVYVYLFAKNDRENITPKELKAFKKLSGDFEWADIGKMLKNGDLHEICKGGKEK